MKTTEDLQRVDFGGLSREEKLALFLNIYNALVIHAIAELRRNPSGALDRRSFFGDVQYVIGGQVFSLSAIENGLLRANRRAPYNLTKPFKSKDPRLQVILVVACVYPSMVLHVLDCLCTTVVIADRHFCAVDLAGSYSGIGALDPLWSRERNSIESSFEMLLIRRCGSGIGFRSQRLLDGVCGN